MTDDWTPEKEAEEDPAKVQRDLIKAAKDMIKEANERLSPPQPGSVEASPFPPPLTFEEISEEVSKAWAEVKRIASDAPQEIQAHIFRALMNSHHY